MPVNNEHELYSEFKNDWKEIRDCVKGNRAIKKAREAYLPMLSGQSNEDYSRYIKRVKFFGATGRTLDGLHGNVFRKAPEQSSEVSESFKKSAEDVDLMGTNLEQFASDVFYDCLQTNWGGILVDYARGDEAESLLEAEKKGLKWYLKYYPAETVINWEYKTINGRTQLCFAVLVEPYTERDPKDRFAAVKHCKYRVLYIDGGSNTYRQDVYDEKYSLTEPVESGIVIKMNGREMTEIPFYTIPASLPEKSMLYDLAQLNLQHYAETADYNHGKHYTSIPTAIAIGLKPKLDEMGNPEPMSIGGSVFKFFPNEDNVSGADVKFLEFTGQGMNALYNGISHLESQMSILGAHIIAAEKKGVETAEALKIHRMGENEVLAAFTRNVSNSITLAMRKKGEGDGEDIGRLNDWSINFNTDYDLSEENAQTLAVLLTGRANGEIPRMSLYLGLKALNLIPEQWDFDEFIAELHNDREVDLPEIPTVVKHKGTDVLTGDEPDEQGDEEEEEAV